jgi:hypothetical protein
MRSNPRTRLRRKPARAGFFNRRACVACAFLAFSLAVVHYRGDIPTLFRASRERANPNCPMAQSCSLPSPTIPAAKA